MLVVNGSGREPRDRLIWFRGVGLLPCSQGWDRPRDADGRGPYRWPVPQAGGQPKRHYCPGFGTGAGGVLAVRRNSRDPHIQPCGLNSAASWLPVVRCRRKRSRPCHNPTWVSGPTRLMAGYPAISADRPKVCHGLWQVLPPSPCHNPAWVSGPPDLWQFMMMVGLRLAVHDDGGPSTRSSHRALSSANRPQRRDHAGSGRVGKEAVATLGVAGHPRRCGRISLRPLVVVTRLGAGRGDLDHM